MREFIIFGASGDLAKRKLYPALWGNYQQGCQCNYFGYGRTDFSTEEFRKIIRHSVPQASENFYKKFEYVSGNYDKQGIEKLKSFLEKNDSVFYLALPTRLPIIKELVTGLKKNDLIGKDSIVVLEKPFGEDYSSAKKLIDFLEKNLGSRRTYLIDHYLAKDLVRNLITLRFANPIFENLWNKDFVERIEIMASESLGVEDRAEYYDKTGAIKDMVQNHVLQVLSLVTMAQPEKLSPESFHLEKSKTIKKLRLFNNRFKGNLKIGQYKGYLSEDGVSQESLTETYVEMRLEVDNQRWRGVEIDVKTGKKLEEKQTEVIVYFKTNQSCLWEGKCLQLTRNKLIINLFPRGDIRLQVNTEFNPINGSPEAKDLTFDFSKESIALPYANALKDIYYNNRLYSPSFEEILSSWKFIDSVENWLKDKRKELLKTY